MKARLRKALPFLMFLSAWAVFAAIFLWKEQLSPLLSGCLWAAYGLLLGFGAVGIVLSGYHLTPEQKKEIERGETDERNMAIREKAAMSSWYCTLHLLWVVFVALQLFVGGLWGAAVSVLIVLHCTFYMVNVYRWSKKI